MRWFICAVLFLAISLAETESKGAEKTTAQSSQTLENVRMAVFPATITALLYVAEDKGFFEHHGLKATLHLYESGITSVEDLIAGKLDIAAVMEYPFATGRVNIDDLRILSSIAASNNLELIMRRDRGIGLPADCRGKRIGVMRGTFGEFFLGVFLSFQGLRLGDVQTVDLKPSEMEAAMIQGAVDGVIIWQPFVSQIRQKMGNKAVSWPAQGSQDSYALLVARDQYVRSRPLVIEKLLRALVDAQDYSKRHTAEAQNIVNRRFGYEAPLLSALWTQNRLEVQLTEDLLTLMDDEARWAMQNKLSPAQKMPNFLNYIYLDALKKIKPEAVTIIH